MDEHMPSSLQSIYIPAIPVVRATLRHSLNRVPIVTQATPEQVCGAARRVGYTGKQDTDLAIYRLKVKTRPGLSTITLPGFYILDAGVFQDYELWQQQTASPS